MNLEELMNLTKTTLAYYTLDTKKLYEEDSLDTANPERQALSNLIDNLKDQLRSYYNELERLKRGTSPYGTLNNINHSYFKTIYDGLKEYIDKRGFLPLTVALEYKEAFSSIFGIVKADIDVDSKEDRKMTDNYMPLLIANLCKYHDALYAFYVDGLKITRENAVFDDDINIPLTASHIYDIATLLPMDKQRGGRPIKVRYNLEMATRDALRNNLSASDIIAKYENAGFDKHCPGDIKDMSRCRVIGR